MPNPAIVPEEDPIALPPRRRGQRPQPDEQAAQRARISSTDFEILPSVLTSREAANVLRVGVREVRALVDSGQLAGQRLGPRKVIRISRAAVLALLGVQSTR
jgi:excisionase family DNA binding protein